MILAAIVIARNPAQYGFDFDTEPPLDHERSRCLEPWTCGASPSGPTRRSIEIQSLNPELRRWTTPLKDTDYELKVPAGTAERVLARLRGIGGARRWHR